MIQTPATDHPGEWFLTLNAGSSSIKFAVYAEIEPDLSLVAKGQVEGIGTRPHFIAKSATGQLLGEGYWEPVSDGRGHARAFQQIWSWLGQAAAGRRIAGVRHRVAHGGERYAQPVLIDAGVIAELTALIPLVPLHQPNNLAAIRSVAAEHPELPQVACFDTGFHRGRARVTELFGLPRGLHARGVRRYGFHGLSGVSNDLRDLHASDDPRAAEAIDYFVYRIGQTLGALVASIGGLDALVFTAGIGENDAALRARVCADAAWLGIGIDQDANAKAAPCISPAGQQPSVWVIPTDEERMIALHTRRTIRGQPGAPLPDQALARNPPLA